MKKFPILPWLVMIALLCFATLWMIIGRHDVVIALEFHYMRKDLDLQHIRQAFENLTDTGKSHWWFFIGAIMGGIGYWKRQKPRFQWVMRMGAFLFAAVAASGILINILKPIFGRTRPRMLLVDPGDIGQYGFFWFRFGSDYGSFPSGHTATLITVAAVILLILWRKAGAVQFWFLSLLCMVLFGALSYTRVIVGAHYPSDVLMGAVVGLLTTYATWHWFTKRDHKFPVQAQFMPHIKDPDA